MPDIPSPVAEIAGGPAAQRPVPVTGFRRWLRRFSVFRFVLSLVLLVIGLLMIAPLIWLISQSLVEPISAFLLPPKWIPIPFTLENFRDVVNLIPIGRMFLNSLLVTVISVVGSLTIASLAAYAFSRIPFAGRDRLFILMLTALMVPGQLTIIPIFIMMRKLGLIDHLGSLFLPALINVFAIFFLRQYFNSIPRDLDEAARIDGAGHLRILFQILLPLAGPALSALAILGFEASWNNYFGALIFLSTPERMTLPIGLVSLAAGQGGGPAVVVFAGITLVVVPILVVFLAFQRNFVESVASVGIRG
jgi:multiple sugar transport system permease protein